MGFVFVLFLLCVYSRVIRGRQHKHTWHFVHAEVRAWWQHALSLYGVVGLGVGAGGESAISVLVGGPQADCSGTPWERAL